MQQKTGTPCRTEEGSGFFDLCSLLIDLFFEQPIQAREAPTGKSRVRDFEGKDVRQPRPDHVQKLVKHDRGGFQIAEDLSKPALLVGYREGSRWGNKINILKLC
ncbi:hypothetical protein VPNG_06147 [Cytospora leucostoma]|uniref:Uncharacterized protein n=1 Tax=Cytospora leucostoma TaxID=1230097 RepID=A0A423WYL1_9PEZI|nr:hypothetical protein VPNG_06147 [Cytospora leucostoma]